MADGVALGAAVAVSVGAACAVSVRTAAIVGIAAAMSAADNDAGEHEAKMKAERRNFRLLIAER